MRVFLLVLDGFGIGAQYDADSYGDVGSNTYAHVRSLCDIPNLRRLGLDHIDGVSDVTPDVTPIGYYCRMAEESKGKDTMTGHWEMAGIVTKTAYPTYPNGFPDVVIERLEKAFGRAVIGNIAISGTKIIADLGPLHMATGYPIVYTSADSVLQIAAHTSVIPLQKLYDMCEKARGIMMGEYGVARIIARPFEGEVGNFVRTPDRKDYVMRIPDGNMLSVLAARGYAVKSVGKINDIFGGVGITDVLGGHSNCEVFDRVLASMDDDFSGLVFANLVETDMNFGHRNDIQGYAACVSRADVYIGQIMAKLREDDVMIVTADHGCDPGFPTTDHTREYVPLLMYGKSLVTAKNGGTVKGFYNISKIILDNYLR